jgi:hypothetical protein
MISKLSKKQKLKYLGYGTLTLATISLTPIKLDTLMESEIKSKNNLENKIQTQETINLQSFPVPSVNNYQKNVNPYDTLRKYYNAPHLNPSSEQ